MPITATTNDLLVLVPTRGRPGAVRELATAFEQTCTANTGLVFAVDHTDPLLPQYCEQVADAPGASSVIVVAGGNMVTALNEAAVTVIQDGAVSQAIGFMGDDHRPRTRGWDRAYLDELNRLGTGMVYGDDLIHGASLPTQIAMTVDIVRTLGWMAPPELWHLYVDNAWLALGRAINRISYLEDAVVQHCHPIAQTGKWDEGYDRVNSGKYYRHDEDQYRAWVTQQMPQAARKLQELLGGVS